MALTNNALITDAVAWALLRQILKAPTLAQNTAPVVHHDRNPDAWLQVFPSGDWKSSSQPTHSARELLSLYAPLTTGASLTIAQLGQSLDGRIATPNGHSHIRIRERTRQQQHDRLQTKFFRPTRAWRYLTRPP